MELRISLTFNWLFIFSISNNTNFQNRSTKRNATKFIKKSLSHYNGIVLGIITASRLTERL
jgi:hypothetical protein